MACTPETLFPDARCFMYLNDRQLLAIWANLICDWSPTPPSEEGITTDPDGEIITTEGGTIITPD